jgi:DNA-directed RNA polymerase III subunit RPC7
MEILERRRNGPLYTILNDGMKSGLKRRDNEKPPTEAQLFNPFTDNLTYSAKYHKEKRKLPRFDQVRISKAHSASLIEAKTNKDCTDKNFFPRELWGVIGATDDNDDEQPTKKRKVGPIVKDTSLRRIDKFLEKQAKHQRGKEDGDDDGEDFDEEDEDEDKPDAVNEEDNFSVASSDSEESNDDYNAERYFDNGDDASGDDGDGYENTYE